MNPRVRDVTPNPDHRLRLLFDNGEERLFDMRPYLDKGVFRELQDERLFRSVRPFMGSVAWSGGQDLCPDTLYEESESVTREG